ncbi:MAG TPA: ATP-dependent metallopeptidase FtsH/Yme1/Tma family protein, partial [Prochlorococcaceae cyanobacterium Gl_MAG_24]|nr:ATP-dependent metallopeptidase FtsH/Yme1/Tma family protein [Prochlorococcaceae cyanobacterium Gl_MAG_24]
MDKRWRNLGLYLLLVVVVLWGGSFLIRAPGTTERETLRYSEFVEAVQDNQVSRVTISTDQSTAKVVERDGRNA